MSRSTKNSVSASVEIASKFWKAVKRSVVEKTLDGEPVRAIDVSAVSKNTGDAFGERNRWTVAKCVQQLEIMANSLPDGTKFPPVYKKHSLKWKGENSFLPTFVAKWNESGGKPDKCSELIGTTKWGEPIMTPHACETKYDMEVQFQDHGLVAKTGTYKVTQAVKKITDEEVISAIAEDLADILG
jgi:hypothetical protein